MAAAGELAAVLAFSLGWVLAYRSPLGESLFGSFLARRAFCSVGLGGGFISGMDTFFLQYGIHIMYTPKPAKLFQKFRCWKDSGT